MKKHRPQRSRDRRRLRQQAEAIRAEINMETVNSYAEAMTEGAKFPPVVLFGTEGKCWIGDGWHRVMAAEQIDAMDIPAELRDGGKDDALWYAMGANKAHGLPMKRGDVKRAVELAVKTWPNKSQREIAEQVGCTKQYVGQLKAEISKQVYLPPTRTTSDGRQYPATRRPGNVQDLPRLFFELHHIRADVRHRPPPKGRHPCGRG